MSPESFASSCNPSLAWVMGNGGKGRLLIEFPFALDSGWYKEQLCTQFRILEHRKERKGLRHEFIIMRLLDGSVCRIERMGDPNARFDAVSSHGSIAYDVMQCFRPEDINEAFLTTSEVIAEIILPCTFDIVDVLKICRAIHEGAKTRNYTLQVLNCYFFSLAIQVCLTRFIAYWEDDRFFAAWISQVESGIKDLADSDSPPAPVLERLYNSVLIPSYSRSGCKNSLMQRIHREFQSRIEVHAQFELAQKELAHCVNSILWYSYIDSGLGQVIEEWFRNIIADIVRICVDAMARRAAPGVLKTEPEKLRDQLIEILTGESTSGDWVAVGKIPRNSRNFQHEPMRLKQRLVHESISGPKPPYAIAELSYNRPLSVQTTDSMTSDWSAWLVTCLPYSSPWALNTVLNKWGLRLFVPPDAPIEETFQVMLAKWAILERTAISDLERLMEETHMLVRDRVATWDDNPWVEIRDRIMKHVTVDIREEFEKRKPMVAFRSTEHPDFKPIRISDFQDHIFKRIKAHANVVEYTLIGSAVKVEAELKDMLSQVWKLIRDDDSIPEKTQFVLDDDSQGGGPDPSSPLLSQPSTPMAPVANYNDSIEIPEGDTRSAPAPTTSHSEPFTGTTIFTRRSGVHVFPPVTPYKTPLHLVNLWHILVFSSEMGWDFEAASKVDHRPEWTAIPIISGEMNPQFRGVGMSRKEAKQDSAQKIMNSGHC